MEIRSLLRLCAVPTFCLGLLLTGCEDDSGDTNSDGGAADAASEADATNDASGDASGGGAVVADPEPSTVGNDAPGAVACGEVDDCGDQLCCVVGFGTVSCEDSCEGIQANCDGPEDCSDGEVCCGSIGSDSVCTTSCVDDGTFTTISCHEDTDCRDGRICEPGDSFTWWGFCK